ncbi:MAG: UDP-GlcNAc--UDP-phosphate GlcNAc-1-phosphate transferase [Bacteroidetes bacterium]|nr:UDP-GlcNAc--UDP-phosphate GlcNAc-1-phosphate transferase [Bacteroidota bacterium]
MMELGSFLILVGINFLLINLFFRLAVRWKIVDTPNERSSHKNITIRGGGIVVPLAWLIYAAWNNFAEPYITLAIVLIAIISFVDDFKPQKPLTRVLVHVTALLLVYYQFALIPELDWFFFVPVLIVSIGLLNAVNFMDGINGISLLYFFVFLASCAFVSEQWFGSSEEWWSLKNPYIFLFSALMVFGFYNLRAKAKTFAGDVGSVSIGFLMIVFLINTGLSQNSSNLQSQFNFSFNWNYIFFLAIYGIDSILTIAQRLYQRENIFKAHRSHLYQLLCNDLAWPHLLVAFIYAGIQLAFNLYIIFCLPHLGLTIGITAVLALIYIVIKVLILKTKKA